MTLKGNFLMATNFAKVCHPSACEHVNCRVISAYFHSMIQNDIIVPSSSILHWFDDRGGFLVDVDKEDVPGVDDPALLRQ